jgi:NADPH2:quinone reductase
VRAWRVHAYGRYADVLRLEEVADPAPPDDGVVARVRAIGLNFPDLLAIAGRYQVKSPLPFTPGLECAGVIEAVGPASRFRVGQRVLVNDLAGALAERIAARDARVFAVPDAMDDADAAALFVAYQTGWFALHRRAALRPGETLLVHGGAGGVGSAAIQLGKDAGARVIATAGGADKAEVCRRLGADDVIDHKAGDLVEEVKRLTGGRGADVIYDPVGGDVFDQSTRCIAWEGRLLVIGFAGGRIPEIAANRILLKNIAIVGVHWGEYHRHDPGLVREAHDAICAAHARGAVDPLIGGRYRFDDAMAGLAALEARAAIGKLVVDA